MSPERRRLVVGLGVAAGVGLLAWLLLLPHVATSVQPGDGAEYALAASTGALVHPPGYPLYTTLIDVLVGDASANPYAAVATFSLVCQVLAAAALAALCLLLSRRVSVAVGIAVAWLLYEGTLRTGTDAEVFAFHHVISLAVAATALALIRGAPRPRLVCFLLGALCGLGGSHHQTIIFWAPLVLGSVALLELRGRQRRGLFVALLLVGALVGLTPYALLPWRFTAAPDLAFSEVTTLRDIVSYMLREPYGTLSISAAPGDLRTYLPHFFVHTIAVLPLFWAAVPLAVIGWQRSRRPETLLLGLTVLAHIGFITLLRFPNDFYTDVALRFYPATLLAGCLALADGLGSLATRPQSQTVFAAALILPALIGLPEALQRADARADRRGEVYLREAFATIPEGAVWLTSTDTSTFGASYWQGGLGRRQDIVIVAEKRLPLTPYRRLIGERFPWLLDASGSVPDSAGEVARQALQAGRPVVSGPLPPGPGLVIQPRGVFAQWYRQEEAPGPETTARHLLLFCARWPEELRTLPPARAETVWVWNDGFTSPLTAVMMRTARRVGEPALAIAAEALRAGDDETARSTCRHALFDPR